MGQVFNPFLPPGEYIPDGEPHVFGDRVYLFGSHDREGGEKFCMLDYVTYSAPVGDLTDWRYEGIIYRAAQDPDCSEKYRYMYAPDVVRGNDGKYYLYYAMSGGAFTGPIKAAVSDVPQGPYRYHGCVRNPDGTPFTRKVTFDPAVINDGGVIRLYFGFAMAAPQIRNTPPARRAEMRQKLRQAYTFLYGKTAEEIGREPDGIEGGYMVVLADDMLTILTEPKLVLGGQLDALGTDFEGHAFFEASSMRKVGDTYYYIYSSENQHELCYATSKFPDRDFRYGGTIISNGDIGLDGRREEDRLNATGNNHGSIERIGGQWYVFYHRQTHLTNYSRQAMAERIEISPDGKIAQVGMTSQGLNGKPLAAMGVYPAVICCNLSNGKMPHIDHNPQDLSLPMITHGEGTRYITGVRDKTRIGYKYFDFGGKAILSLRIRGNAAGTIRVLLDDEEAGAIAVLPDTQWHDVKICLEAAGKKALFLEYAGNDAFDFESFTFTPQESAGR